MMFILCVIQKIYAHLDLLLRCLLASSKLMPAAERLHLSSDGQCMLHQLDSPGADACWFPCSRRVQRRGGLKWSDAVLASSSEMPDAGTGSMLSFCTAEPCQA